METKTWDFRVYSMGQDGRSASGGNDPDDINSWDDHHSGFYQRANVRYCIRGLAIATLVFGLPVFLVVHLLHFGARAVWRSRRMNGKS